LRKLAAVLPGRKLLQFACVSRGCNDAAIDLDVWKRKIISELPVEVEQRDLPSSGRAARRLFQQWLRQFHQVLATFEWLASVGYPCDISGTKGGVPLERRVTSALENTVSLTKSGRLKADALVVLREHGLRAMLALVQSAKQNMQERAACAMANLLASDDAGRAFVQKFRALEPVRAMLSGHHLGLQKQASRLMVNAWIAPSQRVLAGCPSEALSQPFRTKAPVNSWKLPPGVQPSPAEERPAGATEWMLIECSPAGEPQALQQLWMFTDSTGLLVAQGVDELGAYVLSEASDRRCRPLPDQRAAPHAMPRVHSRARLHWAVSTRMWWGASSHITGGVGECSGPTVPHLSTVGHGGRVTLVGIPTSTSLRCRPLQPPRPRNPFCATMPPRVLPTCFLSCDSCSS